MDAIHSPAKPPRSGMPVRSLLAMAARNLRRLPGRTLLGVTGLAVGVGALTVLLGINLAFDQILEGNLLGEAIGVQVRPVDYLSVALAVGLGGLSVADVLYINFRERAAELVTLRAAGWGERHLAMLGLLEGLGMGVIGGFLGAVVGLVVAVLLGGSITLTAIGLSALAALGGVVVALVASLVPVISLSRMTPPGVLAEE